MAEAEQRLERVSHSFYVAHAEAVGIVPAILLHDILHWLEKNKANEKHFHNGQTWTYNSVAAFEKLYPYLTRWQIRSALDRLVRDGLLVRGNFNKSLYDRTSWFGEGSKSICAVTQLHLMPTTNGNAAGNKPIPTHTNSGTKRNKSAAGFAKPTCEQLETYAQHIDFASFDAQDFLDHYEANGWKVGRVPMKDWQAAVRTWKRHQHDFKPKTNKPTLSYKTRQDRINALNKQKQQLMRANAPYWKIHEIDMKLNKL